MEARVQELWVASTALLQEFTNSVRPVLHTPAAGRAVSAEAHERAAAIRHVRSPRALRGRSGATSAGCGSAISAKWQHLSQHGQKVMLSMKESMAENRKRAGGGSWAATEVSPLGPPGHLHICGAEFEPPRFFVVNKSPL